MSLEQNKEVARQYFEEIFNQHNFEVIEAITAQDFIEHGVAPFQSVEVQEAGRHVNGPEHMQAVAHRILTAFPDVQYSLEQLIAEGDLVAMRSTWQGTHLGAFWGSAPTGKRFKVTRTDVLRIVDGKVVEHWANRDDLGMFLQLGVLQAPQSSPG
jgi:predicted ester cyclase